MQVPIVGGQQDAKPYLDMLKGTVEMDIEPLLHTQHGAPHTVAREFCCYVDYLGLLYTGNNDQVRDRFRAYLRDVLGTIDEGYRTRAEHVYAMYRNGAVHEFDPKVLTDGTAQLRWLSYRGARRDECSLPGDGDSQEVQHLVPIRLATGQSGWYLPVSTPCLVEDLKQSFDRFAEMVECEKWNRAARVLRDPTRVDFTLP